MNNLSDEDGGEWEAVLKEVESGPEITVTLQMDADQDDNVFKEWLGAHDQFHNIEIAFVKNRFINWLGKLFGKEWSVERVTIYECAVEDVKERIGPDGEVTVDMSMVMGKGQGDG